MNALEEYGVRNGNGHHNGNGHAKKVFELAPVKGPEEAEQEFVKEIAPKIRRRCFCDPELSPGAKYFFAALLDFSFLFKFGGTAKGIIYITKKNLCGILGHDPKSISAWRDELADRGWIWFEDEWPICQWRICAICPPPEGRAATPYQLTLGKAAAEEQKGKFPSGDFSAENGHSLSEVQSFPSSPTKDSASRGETFPLAKGDSPLAEGNLSAETRGKSPSPHTKDSLSRGEPLVCDKGKVSPQRRESLPDIKESPRRSGGTGDKGGGNPPPDAKLAAWKLEMQRLYADKREPHRKRIEAQMQRADSPEFKQWCRARLEFLNELSMGGKPPAAAGKSAAPKPAPKAEKPGSLSQDELIAHIEFCVGSKKLHLITAEQRQKAKALGMTWKGVKL